MCCLSIHHHSSKLQGASTDRADGWRDHQVTVIIVAHAFKHCIMMALEVSALQLKTAHANRPKEKQIKNNFTNLRTCAGHI